MPIPSQRAFDRISSAVKQNEKDSGHYFDGEHKDYSIEPIAIFKLTEELEGEGLAYAVRGWRNDADTDWEWEPEEFKVKIRGFGAEAPNYPEGTKIWCILHKNRYYVLNPDICASE